MLRVSTSCWCYHQHESCESQFGKLCKTVNCETLQNIAKRCKTIFAKVCESLRKAKPAKSYLQKLAKPKYFYESIFANPCKNTCISHQQILPKTRYAKTNGKTLHCKVSGLQKVYLFLAPGLLPPTPPGSGRVRSSPASSAWSSSTSSDS